MFERPAKPIHIAFFKGLFPSTKTAVTLHFISRTGIFASKRQE
ncbi:hypothetical protein HMPREF9441_00422 [Paraprevotella clara YIT 11840]|uniref:Uncharacterized protein n=1 Tax=Paraprevotella clara YIT 11840 TaxID=762968 RepID=G5SM49_9BACT|nr:hypothetical protein HMPREF9441_00422 [Paraprevotella clara YIT 11840]